MTLIQRIKTHIKGLDQYGALYKPSISKDTEYKTVFGGLLSIILYGICFSYYVYEFVLWREGEILPRVTQSNDVLENIAGHFENPLFSIQMRKQDENSVDPFDPQNLILMPIVMPIINGAYSNTSYTPNISKSQNNEFTTVLFGNISLALSSEKTEENPEVQLSIVLIDCLPSLLKSGMRCANSTTREKFFNHPVNSLYFTTFVKKFNAYEEQIKDFSQTLVVALDTTSTYFSTTTLTLQEIVVDDGILVIRKHKETFIFDAQSTGQQVNNKYFQKVLNATTYFINNYQLSGIKSLQFIQYPKIDQVLAETGAIVELLLLTSIMAVVINEKLLESTAIKSIITIYYPSFFKNLKFNKNWYGKITKVSYQGKPLNIQKFDETYKQLKMVAQKKLTTINQIYEISRLQFLFQSMLPRNDLCYSHSIGIKEQNIIEKVKFEEKQTENGIEYLTIKDGKMSKLNESKIDMSSNPMLKQEPVKENNVNLSNLEIDQQIDNSKIDKQQDYVLNDEDFGLLLFQGNMQYDEQMSKFFQTNKIS